MKRALIVVLLLAFTTTAFAEVGFEGRPITNNLWAPTGYTLNSGEFLVGLGPIGFGISDNIQVGTNILLFLFQALRRAWSACAGPGRCPSLERILFLSLGCMLMSGLLNGIMVWIPVASLFFLFLALLLAVERMVPVPEAVLTLERHETCARRYRRPYPVP